MAYSQGVDNTVISTQWPTLGHRAVVVGGVRATYEQAVSAIAILKQSRTSAIAPVLRAAGNPLAGCAYFAAAAPYLARARQAPKTGRAGAAGRHVTKLAFIRAIDVALGQAAASELALAMEAFGTDERYAVAMAREAVALRERAHAAALRQQIRQSMAQAMSKCEAQAGKFTCPVASACGTGRCRFSSGEVRALIVPASPGRMVRPSNHIVAGESFGDAAAVTAFLELRPYKVGVLVSDSDECVGNDDVAA